LDNKRQKGENARKDKMGKGKIKIGEKGSTYIPDELRDDGYTGWVTFLANARTVTLIKPGTNLEDVERSLRIVLQDVKLRRSGGEELDRNRSA